jgi:hypothetical protein
VYFARLRAAKPQVSTPFAPGSSVRFRALQQFFAWCLDEAELGRARATADGHDGPKYVLTGPESITHADGFR